MTPKSLAIRASTCLAGALLVAAALGTAGSVLEAQPACVPLRDGKPVMGNQDALARLLAARPACPSDVVALRARIRESGGVLATAFIGNRSFHNPGAGSFSLFEIVGGSLASIGVVGEGEFFFGHFTAAAGSRLVLDQNPARGSLMVEAIAWDPSKGVFNFYELIGNGTTGAWTYNGDSGDILADTALLHRQRASGQAPFGSRLRCSGCHVNGGPIMKELAAPRNDWWSKERLIPLGGRQFDGPLAGIATGFVGGDRLSASVRIGMQKLATSAQYNKLRAGRSLQEQLRPLFCPVEVNFESDERPLDDKASVIALPSAILVDPRLAERPLQTSRTDYEAALKATGSRFPEINRPDADHAWLGPVKARSDQMAIQFTGSGLVDEEFVSDVLAVDFTNPALSPNRCRLLQLVPVSASGDWQAQFRSALAASGAPEAKELLANLTDADRDQAAHRQRASRFLQACGERLKAQSFVVSALRLLGQRRVEIAANEISRNPRGQILEPGFRVIFPQQSGTPQAGALGLSETCEIAKVAA